MILDLEINKRIHFRILLSEPQSKYIKRGGKIMNTNEKNIYIDTHIPLEQQIAFLRQSVINLKINTFEVLKDKLGSEGIEIFKTIVRNGIRQAIDKHKGKTLKKSKSWLDFLTRSLAFN